MISPAKKQVSLLPTENDPNSLSARVVNWLTTVGRVVIIFTELVVVSAFASRFWLDRTNADLSEALRQQQAILDSTQQFQSDYQNLKTRLSLISKLKKSPNLTGVIDTIIKSTPSSINFTSLKVDPQSDQLFSTLSLVAYDTNSMVNFITNLVLNPNIDNVVIGTITKAPKTSFYDLSVNITFNKDFSQQNEI